MLRVPKETHPLHLIILFQVETTLYKFLRVWTKRGVGHGLRHGLGHGLPHGLAYGLSVVNFFKTRLSIAVSLCKQRALSMCHICDSQSILLAAFRANFLSRLAVDKNQRHQNGVLTHPCGTIERKSSYYKAPLANGLFIIKVFSIK